MKARKLFNGLVLGCVLLMSWSAFAQSKASLEIGRPLTFNGIELQPGRYKLHWEGTGPSVQLSILKGKNVLATMPARLASLETPYPYDAVVTRDGGEVGALAGFRFKRKSISIDLVEPSGKVQAASAR
jgi:hypothetical protein